MDCFQRVKRAFDPASESTPASCCPSDKVVVDAAEARPARAAMSVDDAYIAGLEHSLAERAQARPADDAELSRVRDSLAICYRNRGQPDRAAALYAGVHVCEHLEPVRQYLLQHGAAIVSAGQAWSSNCHLWIYFDAVLDPESLRSRFALPSFVVAHAHRGTHDGAEQGLVCNAHRDALMGGHPEVAVNALVIG
jgi:hypothetical protein